MVVAAFFHPCRPHCSSFAVCDLHHPALSRPQVASKQEDAGREVRARLAAAQDALERERASRADDGRAHAEALAAVEARAKAVAEELRGQVWSADDTPPPRVRLRAALRVFLRACSAARSRPGPNELCACARVCMSVQECARECVRVRVCLSSFPPLPHFCPKSPSM